MTFSLEVQPPDFPRFSPRSSGISYTKSLFKIQLESVSAIADLGYETDTHTCFGCKFARFHHGQQADNRRSSRTQDRTESHTIYASEMCFYEKIKFPCGHAEHRLMQHCHFARNDPGHQCFGAWNIRRTWDQQETNCTNCVRQSQYNSSVHTTPSAYTFAGER